MAAKIGAHMPNQAITEQDFSLFAKGKLEAAKLMWYHTLADAQRIKALSPAAYLLVRLPDSRHGDGRYPGYLEYATECLEVIKRFYPLVSNYQLDNEPQYTWGADKQWEWQAFMSDVIPALKTRLANEGIKVRIGFTSLSYPNLEGWLAATKHIAEQLDFICVDSYWQADYHITNDYFGGNAAAFYKWVPKPIVVAEVGSSLHEIAGVTPAQAEAAKVAQYPLWVQWASTQPYIEAGCFFILGGSPDWQGFRLTEPVAKALASQIEQKGGPVDITINRERFKSTGFWVPEQVKRLFGVTRRVDRIVIHDTEGTFPSDANWLLGQNEVSAHYVIHENEIYELVNPDNAAWHAACKPEAQTRGTLVRAFWGYANENIHSIGIEISGLRNGAKSAAVMESTAKLVAYLMGRYPGIKLNRQQIVGHYELNTGKVDCMPFDWDSFMRRVQFYLEAPAPQPVPAPAPAPQPTPAPDSIYFEQTKHTVKGAFKVLFDKLGGVATCGYPLTEEEPELSTGLLVQWFENTRMEYKPDNPAYPRLGAVGRMYLQLTRVP